MGLTRTGLLRRLQGSITADEWEAIAHDDELLISGSNRRVLSELRHADIEEDGGLQEDAVSGLYKILKRFLQENLRDEPQGHKWVIISCLYLAFIAERPMHPIERTGIKVSEVDGQTVYECPIKENGKDTACHYCVCRRMSNYEITKRRVEKDFLKYDQEEMIRKFRLVHDPSYIYIRFLDRAYRVSRTDGKVSWSEDGLTYAHEAGYNDAMTIYDILCYSKEDCHLSGVFVHVQSLASLHPVAGSHFQKVEEAFDHKGETLARACERLRGTRLGRGDVAYQIPLFDFLPIQIQFWDSDDEFPASLQIFTDKNMLDYMRYETVWYAIIYMLERIQEEFR